MRLPEEMAASLRALFLELPKEEEVELSGDEDAGQRNRRIDEHLEKLEQEERNESFLEFMSKANEKLIYE
jgi:hypothetical protein